MGRMRRIDARRLLRAQAPLAYDPATGRWSSTSGLINLPAVFIIVLVAILLVIGIKELAKVNSAIVAVKLVVIVTFILAGAWFVKASNWVTPSKPIAVRISERISTSLRPSDSRARRAVNASRSVTDGEVTSA